MLNNLVTQLRCPSRLNGLFFLSLPFECSCGALNSLLLPLHCDICDTANCIYNPGLPSFCTYTVATVTAMGRASQACHGCRTRKVRCSGSHPCSQCAHLNLTCVYITPLPTKRRQGSRGRLVEQLRQGGAARVASYSEPRPPREQNLAPAPAAPVAAHDNAADGPSRDMRTASVMSIAGLVAPTAETSTPSPSHSPTPPKETSPNASPVSTGMIPELLNIFEQVKNCVETSNQQIEAIHNPKSICHQQLEALRTNTADKWRRLYESSSSEERKTIQDEILAHGAELERMERKLARLCGEKGGYKRRIDAVLESCLDELAGHVDQWRSHRGGCGLPVRPVGEMQDDGV